VSSKLEIFVSGRFLIPIPIVSHSYVLFYYYTQYSYFLAAKYLLSKNLERTDFDESGMARRRKAFSTRLLWESLVAQDRPPSLSLLEILEFPRFSI
jgi:hypothetical protein